MHDHQLLTNNTTEASGWPLRKTLGIWFCGIAALSCLAVGTLTYYLRANGLRQLVSNELSMVRDDKIRDIQHWFGEKKSDITLWSDAIGIVRAAEEHVAGKPIPDLEIRQRQLDHIRDSVHAHSVGLFDAKTGTAILSSSGPSSHDELADAIRERVLKEKATIHTDVFVCSQHQKPTLVFAAPIRSFTNERPIVGVMAFFADLEGYFYPEVLKSNQLGQTGEILLLNRDRTSQSPLKHVIDAPGHFMLSAEPARLAAAGLSNVLVARDYFGVPVMAAHGFLPEVGWGIVAKQDYSEITAVITGMARHVAIVSAAALLASSLLGWLVAGKIAATAAGIADVSERIRSGQTGVRTKPQGPRELRTVARNFNSMMDRLEQKLRTGDALSSIFSAASAQNRIGRLVNDVLPRIMEVTRSQAGVFYINNSEANIFRCLTANGTRLEDLADEIHTAPPDHLLAQAAASGEVRVITGLHGDHELRIQTQSGISRPTALMSIPLFHSGRPIAIIGLASLHDYRPEDIEVAQTLSLSLGQSVAAAQANEKNMRMTEELRVNNEELSAANEELQTQTEELQQQSEELQQQTEELAQQRAAVEEADRLKSQFLSNMSHELRTPLNSIMALSQLMLARGTGTNPQKEAEYLRIVERNGRHLLNLINDILDLSKIESGRMDLSPTIFQPEHLVHRALEVARPLAEAKGLAIKVEADQVPAVYSDQDKVHQILLNLLSNAVKFTDRGQITVTIKATAKQVLFSVQDTGIGISQIDLPKIFDEFRQVDGSTTRRHDGTGLGLAIAQKLSRLLGGELTVETHLGQGSTFTLALPICRAATGKPVTISPSEQGPRQAGRAQTVLVVDDDPSVRNLLKNFLVESGYDVLLAASGHEALTLARQNKIHAVTLDVLMPDMDGWEVIRELKARPETASVPILVISVTESRATALALGASAFMVKPVDKHVLTEELERLSRKKPVSDVLVVDDDASTRQHLSLLLQDKYHEIRTASGGEEALKLIHDSAPDAIILDLMMPDMDGFTVLDRLRQDPATAHIPVLILTAKDLTGDERQRLRKAVSQIVTKGTMDRDRLLNELRTALADLEQPIVSNPGSSHVLVVDDDEIAAIQISSALEDAGYATSVARSGDEALARAREAVPDAVVLDIMMPGMDGFEVLQQLRSVHQTANVPVLILTAKELTANDRARLAGNRVRQLLQKGSVDRDQLVGVVHELLSDKSNKPETAPQPAPDNTVAAENSAGKSEPAKPPSGDGVILVVEDNPDNLITIGAVLNDMGHRHAHAANGEEAIRKVRELRPRLVLMDMQLPVLSGMEAVRQIKSDPELASIPIVALTAKAMRGDREQILAAGCDGYMAKPLDRAELARVLARWAS